MGLDYMVKFRKEMTFKEETDSVFSPFTRRLRQFIGNHLNRSESLLTKVELATGIELRYITKPNLYAYKISDLQLEFVDKPEKERLFKRQKELDAEAHKAWYKIEEFNQQLNFTINSLLASEELKTIEYNRKWWCNYLEDGCFIADLKALSELLNSAQQQNQVDFTFLIY